VGADGKLAGRQKTRQPAKSCENSEPTQLGTACTLSECSDVSHIPPPNEAEDLADCFPNHTANHASIATAQLPCPQSTHSVKANTLTDLFKKVKRETSSTRNEAHPNSILYQQAHFS
jgi:hypothetical protein